MPTVKPWLSVKPNRKDEIGQERAIVVLDQRVDQQNGQIITDLTTIEGDITNINTAITNITNGTTTVAAKWSAYSGPIWIAWWMMLNG